MRNRAVYSRNEISICGIFVWMEWKLNWKQNPNLMNINAGVCGCRQLILSRHAYMRIGMLCSLRRSERTMCFFFCCSSCSQYMLEFQMEIFGGGKSLIRLWPAFRDRELLSYWLLMNLEAVLCALRDIVSCRRYLYCMCVWSGYCMLRLDS